MKCKIIFILLISLYFLFNLYSLPVKIGSIDSEYIMQHATNDNYLYYYYYLGFRIFDISDPLIPQQICDFYFDFGDDYTFSDLIIQNQFLIANVRYWSQGGEYSELYFFDVSNPFNLSYLSNMYIGSNVLQIKIIDGYIIIRKSHSINIYDLYTHNVISSISFSEYSKGFDIRNNFLYITTHQNLKIYDISNISEPLLVSTVSDIIGTKLVVSNDIFYIQNDFNTISLYNISNPLQPLFIFEQDFKFWINGLVINNNYIYVNDDSNIYIFELHDNSIEQISKYETPYSSGFVSFNLNNDNGYILLHHPSFQEIRIVNFSDLSTPPTFININDIGMRVRSFVVNETDLFIGQFNNVLCYNYEELDNPEFVSSYTYDINGTINKLVYENNILFSIFQNNYDPVFSMFQISDSNEINEIGYYYESYGSFKYHALSIIGNHAIIGVESFSVNFVNHLKVLDFSTPSNINNMNEYELICVPYDTHREDNILFLANVSGLSFFDISNTFFLENISNLLLEGNSIKIEKENNIVYLVNDENGIQIFDVTDIENPQHLTDIKPYSNSMITSSPFILENTLIFYDNLWNEIFLYDISDHSTPVFTRSLKINMQVNDFALCNDELITISNTCVNVIDLSSLLTADHVISKNLFLNISNYPNPFNPSTTIEFSIQENSEVELSIFNIKGQKIKTLANNEFTRGDHSVIWDGDNKFGKTVSSGMYYYKLLVNGKTEAVKKCLLLK